MRMALDPHWDMISERRVEAEERLLVKVGPQGPLRRTHILTKKAGNAIKKSSRVRSGRKQYGGPFVLTTSRSLTLPSYHFTSLKMLPRDLTAWETIVIKTVSTPRIRTQRASHC